MLSGAELKILIALNSGLMLTMSLAMAFVMRGRRPPDVTLWIGGGFCIAIGLSFIAGRSFLPAVVSFTLANSVVMSGLALQCLALRPAASRLRSAAWLAMFILIFACVYEIIRQSGNSMPVRLIFVSLSNALLALLILAAAVDLYRRERGTGLMMIALAYGGLAGVCIVRAVGIATLQGVGEYMVAAPSATELTVTALQVATTIFSQFGYVSLILERAAGDRMRARERALREEAQRQHIEAENRELAQLLAERSDTLDLLSHEIRQPLNNASAALESLAGVVTRGGSDPASLQSRIERAAQVITDITLTLNNVIAAATSLRDGIGSVHLAAARLDEVAQLALLSFPPGAQERVTRDIPGSVDGVPLDPVLAGLAVRNLLDNALKYAPGDAGVTLAIKVTDQEAVVEVSNPGAPLPPQEATRVFEKRFRASRARMLPGAGLGLYIVRLVAELHGGQAEITARDGLIIACLRLPRSV